MIKDIVKSKEYEAPYNKFHIDTFDFFFVCQKQSTCFVDILQEIARTKEEKRHME
jgi:hypothetical protein